jgi:hypothetical protein
MHLSLVIPVCREVLNVKGDEISIGGEEVLVVVYATNEASIQASDLCDSSRVQVVARGKQLHFDMPSNLLQRAQHLCQPRARRRSHPGFTH